MLLCIVYQMTLGESIRLIFRRSEDRVESYAWGAPGGNSCKKQLATPTLGKFGQSINDI